MIESVHVLYVAELSFPSGGIFSSSGLALPVHALYFEVRQVFDPASERRRKVADRSVPRCSNYFDLGMMARLSCFDEETKINYSSYILR